MNIGGWVRLAFDVDLVVSEATTVAVAMALAVADLLQQGDAGAVALLCCLRRELSPCLACPVIGSDADWCYCAKGMDNGSMSTIHIWVWQSGSRITPAPYEKAQASDLICKRAAHPGSELNQKKCRVRRACVCV